MVVGDNHVRRCAAHTVRPPKPLIRPQSLLEETMMASRPPRSRARRTSFVALTLGLGLLLAARPAAAQSISGASVSTSGSTANSGNTDGSVRSSVQTRLQRGMR
jgi:hypothetical protein